MSINVDKMNSKSVEPRKAKPMLKRRKKNISTSESVSSGSSSPKKHFPNGFVEDYRSSPETISLPSPNSSFYATETNGADQLMKSPYANSDYDKLATVAPQNGTLRQPQHSESASSKQTTAATTATAHVADQSPVNNSQNCVSNSSVNGKRQPRTSEDFYLFCQFILEYENYDEMNHQETLRNSTHSPTDSVESPTESVTSSAVNDESNHADAEPDRKESVAKDFDSNALSNDEESKADATKIAAVDMSSTNEDDDSDIDADSYNLVTCYCGKPYAARPMIECSQCLTWLHLTCAKIKRKHIPDIFICVKCTKLGGGHNNQAHQTNEVTSNSVSSPAKDIHHSSVNGTSEPKENSRSKKHTARSDKIENNILQPLNVSATYETAVNSLENIKASSIAVKYK